MKKESTCRNVSILSMAILVFTLFSCKETKKSESENIDESEMANESPEPFFDLSLAQWSIHRMIREDGVDPYSFAQKAKEWGFSGLEYVSQLYDPELSDANYSEEAMAAFVEKSNAEAKKYGLQNVLIMIDRQGNLAVSDAAERKAAVERHFKWVDAAAAMGCHAIRVMTLKNGKPILWMHLRNWPHMRKKRTLKLL